MTVPVGADAVYPKAPLILVPPRQLTAGAPRLRHTHTERLCLHRGQVTRASGLRQQRATEVLLLVRIFHVGAEGCGPLPSGRMSYLLSLC